MGVNANSNKSFGNLIKEEMDGLLLLPDFQRDFVWSVEQQKSLAATFLVRIPLTSFLLLKGKQNDFSYKRLCMRKKDTAKQLTNQDAGCVFLLDGQQRLSTLKNIFSDIYDDNNEEWDEVFDRIDNKLRYRWFLNLRPDTKAKESDGVEDVFGIENLSTPKPLESLEPSDLLDYIEYKRIKKGDVSKSKLKWWHPAFMNSDYIKTPIAACKKDSAAEYLLPLYKFYEDKRGAKTGKFRVTSTISKIAENRIDELKEEIDNKKKNIDEIFSGELREVYEDDPDDAWSTLKTNWTNAMNEFVLDTMRQIIYNIELDANEIGRAVTIFENMNASGTKLSVFDLVVARAAADNRCSESLTNRIINRLNETIAIPKVIADNLQSNINIAEDMKIIDDNELDTDFKNAFIAMLAVKKKIDISQEYKISSDDVKQNKILKLSSKEISDYTDSVIDSLKRAYAFLQYRCGIISIKQISYRLMVIPIASVFMKADNWKNKKVVDRIECWYWASIFCGAFSSNQNARSSDDVKKLYDFAINGDRSIMDIRIDKIFCQDGYSDLNTLLGKSEDSWSKAMHQGILSYILSNNPPDFQKDILVPLTAWDAAKKRTISQKNVECKIELQDHHLIPLCQDKSLSYGEADTKLRNDKDNILNSPLNRTYITASANNMISKMKIDSYMLDVNSYGKEYHFIPDQSVLKYEGEAYEDYYEKILIKRFKLLRSEMKKELELLSE